MNRRIGPILIGAVCFAAGAALAQPAFDLGKYEYEAKCASCHGTNGQGFGPLRPYLTKHPSDLTTLAKRSGGAFPAQTVWLTVDGRLTPEIGPHGTREMPVWGAEYRQEVLRAAGPEGMAFAQPEWYVRGRIVALLDYLARIQTN